MIVPEYWTVEEAHDAIQRFEASVLRHVGLEGEIVFHPDPCRREVCRICELEACPIRAEPFEGRPPLTLEEARRPQRSADSGGRPDLLSGP